MEDALGDQLDIQWRSFCLQQVNSKDGPEWKAWELPDSETRSMPALRGGVAARKQGKDAYRRFHREMLNARHEQRLQLNDPQVVIDAAKRAGLEMTQFEKDMNDPTTVETIAREHTEAVEKYGAFGTPTFVFENDQAVFLKTLPPPEGDEVAFFKAFLELAANRPYIGEMKHPQPPWPKGVYD